MSDTARPLDDARGYVLKGYAPIPVPHREKIPIIGEWQNLRIQEADLPRYFNGQPSNIGVLLGAPSNDLVDVDIDAAEAVPIADVFLPRTGSEFGRASKPRSHREYITKIKTEKFSDLGKGEDDETAMIVEIRSTGGQTVFPGSTHPSGEAVEWAHDGDPAPIEAAELRRAVVLLGCAAMLARHWPDAGQRHEAALATAGFLARAGVDEADTVKIVMAAAKAAGDPEWADRRHAALDTVAAIRSGEAATGGPRLAELLRGEGEKVVARLRKWLGADAAAGQAGAINAGDQDLARVAEAAWLALHRANDPPGLFRFGGLATRIEHADDGTPAARALTPDRLRYALARAATWYTKRTTEDKSGSRTTRTIPAYPPMVVVRDMLARPDPPLPILERITEAPMFTRAGRLHHTAGYHADGRMFYAPAAGLDVPALPKPVKRVHVALAREMLVENLLGDFPFVSDAEVAHAVALLLLPFGRAFIDGPTPLHLIEKPTPGTGGTLLADVLTHPASGRQLAAMTEGRDEDEWRKRITSKLITSPSVIVLDNVRRRLEASALASALTATVWEDRLLGGSEQIRVPVLAAWCATGNNPALSGEIARRTLRIRLDAKTDRPWLRGGFRHADLRAWAVTNRGELIWAALVLWQGWLDAERPLGGPGLGMFESWARVLGGVLGHAEIVGFLDNLEEFYDGTDQEGATWRRFLDAWSERFGEAETGVSDLWGLVQPATGDPIDLDLGEGSERSQRMRLSKLIGQMRDRQFGSYRIVQGTPYQGAQRWRVVPAPRTIS